MNKRKILLAIKLALGLLLVYVFIDTALIPARVASTNAADYSAGNIDTTITEPQQQNENGSANYDTIVEHNLFGGAGDNLSSAAVATTELPLILQGTISGPSQIARAVILDLSEKGNTPETYRIGDIVAQARIVGIEADAVILSYNGQKQILKLSSRKSPGNNAVLSVSAATAAVSEGKGMDPVSVFENIMKNAVIEPYVVDGNTVGLRVSGLAKLNLPMFAGIKENDVIKSINGQELTSKQKAFQIFKKARTKSRIDVELLRDQQTKNLSLSLR